MGSVTLNRRFNEGVPIWMEVVDVTVAATGDTYQSKFKNVRFAFVNDLTTKGGASVSSISGGEVTIACTNGDNCHLLIIGDIN